ncbi:NACHT domain-containing protein [Nocardia aurea]|uniref:NACHT domain-containing protein n=1 Tax=Nocardia aurea TaxID=2144174 RepID=UPI0033B8FC28
MFELLATDLSCFADPGTEVRSEPEARGKHRVQWVQDGKRRIATFTLEDLDKPWPSSVEYNGATMSYAGFLASPHMADLRGVARNMMNILRPIPSYVSIDAVRVDDTSDVNEPKRGEDVITELAWPGDGRTNVIFVTADAGVGKTSLLQNLTRMKAEEYMRGATTALWIYVDAQGSRLAQLDQAIAAVLDDARAKFPYHATAPLVRVGAMVLVVDGFDELIGSVGSYDEAFSSLASFISDLRGYGCIIAAARSTYYEQEFLARTASTLAFGSDSWLLSAIRLLDWSSDKRQEYVRAEASRRGRAGHDVEAIVANIERALSAADVQGVGYKPFFVSRALDILIEGELPDGTSLLDRLVAAYVLREVAQKLQSPATGTPMLDSDQYRYLLSEVAEEMWRQETRELSNSSVREIAEILGGAIGLQGDILREVVERLPYGAILSQGTLPGGVAFEHDIYYSYFLAEPVARTWMQADVRSLTQLLRRGRLPEEAAAMAGRRLRGREAQPLLTVLSNSTARANGDTEQVKRNAGALAAGFLNGIPNHGLRLSNLIFGDVSMNGLEIYDSTFSRCQFNGTDLSGAKVVRCHADGVQMDRVIVDPLNTELDIELLQIDDFYGLGLKTEFGERWIFSPVELTEVLEACSLPAAKRKQATRDVHPDVVDIIDRLCRLYVKANAIAETDTGMFRIVSDPRWKSVRGALLSAGVLSIETKAASGNKVFLRRNDRPQEIMLGMRADGQVSDSVRKLWDLLELIS